MKLAALLLCFVFVTTALRAQTWEQTNGPSGNGILKIVFNQKKDMFVLSYALLRSTDGGGSWRQVGSQFKNGTINFIAVSAIGDLYIIVNTNTLWKSSDDGQTWTQLSITNTLKYIITSPDSSIHVYGGIQASYRSFDDGATWDSSALSSGGYFPTGGADTKGTLFHCVDELVFRSSDKGASWTKILGLSARSYRNISFAPNGDIYLSGGGTPYGLYRSVDGGLSWQRKFTPNSADTNILGTAVSTTGRVYFIGRYDLLYSDDRGETWNSYGNIYTERGSKAVPSMVWAADPDSGFYVTTIGRLFKGSKPGVWSTMTVPMSVNLSVFCTADGSVLASSLYDMDFNATGRTNGFWRSTTQGNTWEISGEPEQQRSIPFIPNRIEVDSNRTIIAASNGLIHVSDDGIVWQPKTQNRLVSGSINAIVATPNRRLFLATSSDGMLLSPDNGATWWQVNAGLNGMNVTAAAAAQDNTLIAAVSNKLFASTDNGTSWQENPFNGFSGAITKLTFTRSGELYAVVAGDGVYRSTDKGVMWQGLNNAALPSRTILAMLLANDGTTIVSTDSGVFRFSNDSWSRFEEGLTTKIVLSLSQDATGRLYAGTSGTGVFRSETLVADVERTNKLQGITIHYPTPNPASDHLTYGFTCEDAMSVSIGLYEVTGKRVSMLVDQHFSSGSYSFTLSTTGLASGTYLLSFVTPSGTQTRSIVIQ